MHYGKKAFAFPGKISMQTTDPKFQDVIGHQKDASPNDYRKICKIYGCSTCAGGKVDLEDKEGQGSRDKDGDDDHDSVTEETVWIRWVHFVGRWPKWGCSTVATLADGTAVRLVLLKVANG
ncbi:unnamed protein product [Haemonchus placei]|uniref:Astacin domain-containing protein n=1 Tax=Haemonchus placei TaxID=6290 RepID=A0A0N4WAY1_HAEPC|nr:unnamed protein product [Haemonchus placei]